MSDTRSRPEESNCFAGDYCSTPDRAGGYKAYVHIKTKKITFDSVEEIPWTLDGEFGGEQDYVEIENVQKAMEIMVPENHVLELSEQKNKIERD